MGSPVQQDLCCNNFFVTSIDFWHINSSISLTSVFRFLIIWVAWCRRRVLHWFKVRASTVALTSVTSFSAACFERKINYIYEPIDHTCTEPNIVGNSQNTQKHHSWRSPAASTVEETLNSSLGVHQRIWRHVYKGRRWPSFRVTIQLNSLSNKFDILNEMLLSLYLRRSMSLSSILV